MSEFKEEHLNHLKEGIALFNAQKYWECHEYLEDFWIEEPGPVRNVYWAVIQVATSMFHYRQDNLNGAKGMLYKAKQKIDRCEKMHVESELLYEKLTWAKFKKLVRAVPEQPVLSDFKELYDFRFEEPWN